jgi:dienelactone hydrolase
VVLGHGFAMDNLTYKNFADSLTPKGYIVVIPNTESSLIPSPSHSAFGQDLAFLVSYMQQQDTLSSSFYFGKVKDKSAIMGHSMGGGCTFLAASGAANVTTTVTFSAAETTPSAVTAAAGVSCPSLIIGGSADCVAPISSNQQLMYTACGASCKTLLRITNGGHCNYANSNFNCSFGEATCSGGSSLLSAAVQQRIVFDYLYKWLGFYLKGECTQFQAFQDLLTTDSRVTYTQTCDYATPLAAVGHARPLSFCAGDSTILYSAGQYPSYSWTGGSTDSVITISNSSSISLTVTDRYGCSATSAPIAVVENNPVKFHLNPGTRVGLCGLDSVRLNFSFLPSAWTWFPDSSISSSSYYADTDMFVWAWCTDAHGCKSFSDTAHVIASSAAPGLSITPSGALNICYGTVATISADTGFRNYHWSDGPRVRVRTVSGTGVYFCTAVDSNNCSSTSPSLTALVDTAIHPPIYQAGDSLSTDAYTQIRWLRPDGSLIDSNQSFRAALDTLIYLEVSDSLGCKGYNGIRLQHSGIGEIGEGVEQALIFPNPADDQISISFKVEAIEHVEVYNVLGIMVYRNAQSFNYLRIDSHSWPEGAYVLHWIQGSRKHSQLIQIRH